MLNQRRLSGGIKLLQELSNSDKSLKNAIRTKTYSFFYREWNLKLIIETSSHIDKTLTMCDELIDVL